MNTSDVDDGNLQGIEASQSNAPSDAPIWYYLVADKTCGPSTSEELRSLFVSGALPQTTYVYREGMQDWVNAASLPEFQAADEAPTTSQTVEQAMPHSMDRPQGNTPMPSVGDASSPVAPDQAVMAKRTVGRSRYGAGIGILSLIMVTVAFSGLHRFIGGYDRTATIAAFDKATGKISGDFLDFQSRFDLVADGQTSVVIRNNREAAERTKETARELRALLTSRVDPAVKQLGKKTADTLDEFAEYITKQSANLENMEEFMSLMSRGLRTQDQMAREIEALKGEEKQDLDRLVAKAQEIRGLQETARQQLQAKYHYP